MAERSVADDIAAFFQGLSEPTTPRRVPEVEGAGKINPPISEELLTQIVTVLTENYRATQNTESGQKETVNNNEFPSRINIFPLKYESTAIFPELELPPAQPAPAGEGVVQGQPAARAKSPEWVTKKRRESEEEPPSILRPDENAVGRFEITKGQPLMVTRSETVMENGKPVRKILYVVPAKDYKRVYEERLPPHWHSRIRINVGPNDLALAVYDENGSHPNVFKISNLDDLNSALDGSMGAVPESVKAKIKEEVFKRAKAARLLTINTEETSRQAAKLGLARIKAYDDLHAETVEESDRIFKEKTREFWQKIAVHGLFGGVDKEGRPVIKERSDLDGRCAVQLLGLAGFNIKDLRHVAKGGSFPGALNVDTGNRDGIVVETVEQEEATVTAFADHHGKKSKRDTSATKIVYEALVGLGMLNEEEALNQLVNFVTQADNLLYESGGQEVSWRTMVGLQKEVEFKNLLKFFRAGKNPNKALSEEELREYHLKGQSEALKESILKSPPALKEMEEDGLIIDSPRYGRIAVDICGLYKDEKEPEGGGEKTTRVEEESNTDKKHVPAGARAARVYNGEGYIGIYMIWNPDQNSFFISSTNGQEITDEFGQGENIRGTMLIKSIDDPTPLSLTLKEVLEKLTDGKLDPKGKLAVYLEEETKGMPQA